MQESLVLITGGIKSGKSSRAQQLGEAIDGKRAFVATALPLDDEMQERIKKHQSERGDRWATFEEAKDIVQLLEDLSERFDVILIDCITLWLSNLLTIYNFDTSAIRQQSDELIVALNQRKAKIILVTNEVGMGIIPADSLSRSYQNLLGTVNRNISDAADAVYFMVSGIPVKIKP
jgi:adenosylcobinamide kinase/adenosylcobinamide-phosphate guanylyltransferase